ncbi:hypothetical protein DL768_009505 [Monosporascus sp. mg162]|nr:hypothetical protein DL768_009505 [Monosporascus sp. mg162]
MASKRDASVSQTEVMAEARSRASFDVEALTRVIYGDADTVRRRREAWARVEAVLGTSDTSRLPQQYAKTSREDLYIDGLRMGKAAWDDRAKSGHDFFDWMTPRFTLCNNSPFGLSLSMFIKMLELMASPEQKSRWLVPATKGQINGAYMQTELGHGAFVRGLETTATFDEPRDCFLLNTPTLSSTKFWPGAMGFAASHGIVMARLIIKGKDHGVHPFMVQLRDIKTGEAFEGIELGDIGPKLSHNQNDNGFARLKDVVIPRDNMLSAQASVARDGTYARRANVHEKAAYGTMLVTRSKMAHVTSIQLAAAVTIAIRFSTVRKQGNFTYNEDVPGTEIAIIRYRSQHYRLLTTLAKAYAILFASRHCEAAQRDFEKRVAEGDFSTMQSAHALTAGVKAWSSVIALDGAEDCRRACGGHGYLLTSGLPDIVQSLAAMYTAEGDAHILLQQTARYLMKWTLGLGGRPSKAEFPDDLTYLISPFTEKCSDACLIDPTNSSTQLLIFQHRAQYLIGKAESRLVQGLKIGETKAQVWNQHIVLLTSAARAHVEYLVLRDFIEATTRVTDVAVGKVLCKLRSVFALSAIANPQSTDALSFVEDGFLSGTQLDAIRDAINSLLDDLLPEAIGLTDAWDLTDAALSSAIGMKDGNAYETLMKWTEQLPINVAARKDGGRHAEAWDGYIRPALTTSKL